MNFLLNEIAVPTGGVIKGFGGEALSGVCIDTRAIKSGDLFVAIRGAHFDGHDYVKEAAAKGAKAAVVRSSANVDADLPLVLVADTEMALGEIAGWWRSRFFVPCVAITGSNGKSTTKEMVSAVAGALGSPLKTEGNFNNLIGLPLTLFRWNDSHKVAVIEMGMNASGEIRRLASIARPDVALITNVTAAHLEKLHSLEAVAMAKGELFEQMGTRGTLVVNAEDPWVVKVAKGRGSKRITFGMKNDCDVRFLCAETNGLDSMDLSVSVFGEEHRLALTVVGAHNVMNAMAAIGVGVALGIDAAESIKRLELFKPMSMRFERIQLANGVRVVNDSYNANPGSMRVALRTVGSAKRAGRFIAVLGDMLELGDASSELHRELGMAAVEFGVDRLILAGNFANDIRAGALESGMKDAAISAFKDSDTAATAALESIKAGDVVLVKGSRGMKMEKVVEAMKNEIGTGEF